MKESDEKLLQVEWDSHGEKVEIHLNDQGISYLISVLEGLKAKAAPDDVQLMTPEWGGQGLTSSADAGDRQVVNYLKILKW